MKYNSFQHLCTALCDYQLSSSHYENQNSSAQVGQSIGRSSQTNFKRNNNNMSFIKINGPNMNNFSNVSTITNPKKASYHPRKFTLISESYHSIMNQAMSNNILKLPPIKQVDPSKAQGPYFDANSFCHFHQTQGHDTE